VVRTSSAETAIRAIEAIYRGGVRAAEITMTVPGAVRALEKVADQFFDKIVLGAGTVLDPETARICMLAGSEFFVTPSLKPATIEVAERYSKVVCPGALTPTPKCGKPAQTWSRSSPAATWAARSTSKGAERAFPQIEMIPTGGVNLQKRLRRRAPRWRSSQETEGHPG
jgi:2-dehydro-3-deoxyphosphogluconate aldolase/(4S)-4-hydroxy-2-oxoglutarate aldolase